MNRICVYCDKDIGKEIKRKMNCPFCKKTLYVRYGKVVNEREREIIDWQKYMDFLVPDINAVRKEVENELTRRFQQLPSAHDVIWGMFNYIILKLRDPRSLETIYINMAQFLESEGKLNQANDVTRQANKMQIATYLEYGFYDSVKIKNQNDGFVCKECKEENNKIIPIKEALKKSLLPIHACKNKKCRCTYDYINKSDDRYIKSEIHISKENFGNVVIPTEPKIDSSSNIVSKRAVLTLFLFFIGLLSLPGGIVLWIIAAIVYFHKKK